MPPPPKKRAVGKEAVPAPAHLDPAIAVRLVFPQRLFAAVVLCCPTLGVVCEECKLVDGAEWGRLGDAVLLLHTRKEDRLEQCTVQESVWAAYKTSRYHWATFALLLLYSPEQNTQARDDASAIHPGVLEEARVRFLLTGEAALAGRAHRLEPATRRAPTRKAKSPDSAIPQLRRQPFLTIPSFKI